MGYTLALAVEDFIPVILSSIGLFIISQMVKRIDHKIGIMAQTGWVLITLGGLLKAFWKLVMAISDGTSNLIWFDKGMFLWLAAGFTLMAFAIWFTSEMMNGKSRPNRLWAAPAILLALTVVAIFITGFPDPTINTWRFILLGITTIANVILVVLLIQKSRQMGNTTTALLFLTNIILVFILNGLARMPEQTISLQWTEQLLNTFAQGAFLLASWSLAKSVANVGFELD